MKAIRLLMSTILALAALAGLMLALSWEPIAPVHAEEAVSAPLSARLMQHALPTPYLSDDDVVDAPYDNPPAPTVDGVLAPGEYAGAGKVTFPGYGGHYHDVEVFFKHDIKMLYVAFELPDKVNSMPYASLLLDIGQVSGNTPMTDDFEFRVRRDGFAWEYQGDGSGWQQNIPITWTYGLAETMSGWSVEFGIPFSKLGINAGTFKQLGLALENWLTGGPYYYWPIGALSGDPTTWGILVSSSGDASLVPSGWNTFYWKPGPWEDYAPSGMPDFDQRQNGWFLPGGLMGQIWTHDGPASVANSLWWFDTKFEPEPHPPEMITDHYRLVTTYNYWDDHYYSNTVPLVDDLAWYFNTNGLQNGAQVTGTHPFSMFYGIHNYLRDRGLWDDYIVTMVMSPTLEWVTDEVMRSEDVILLMGIYEDQEPDSAIERWVRVGGHYVNVAGVDPVNRQIALSDPLMDAAEQGWRPGRVLSGTLLPHIPIPGHPFTIHNDAGNVSHDVYTVTTTNSPGGNWGPEKYGFLWDPDGGIWIPIWEAFLWIFGANPNPYIDMEAWAGSEDLQTEVEFAIAVSPYTWKASGEWLSEGDDPIQGIWQSWQDYAPNGVPDFDQKQDNWGYDIGLGWQWSFCGPAAAANSLWWFDSKFEPSPVPPSMYNDNYPLVETYDFTDPIWDDHDPLNVDDPLTSWPPGGGWPPPPISPGQGEFIEDLALYFLTDQAGNGTQIFNMYTGIEQYITDKGLRQGYVITMVESPDFWWVAEEVEISEDVILLLGFWQDQQNPDPPDEPEWVRLGGHYVTVPGVDKQGGLVAFSDPYYDGAEFAWPLAYPRGWPTVMGRVADGWLIPHPPYHSHASTVHNDAGNLSHDIYYVGPTNSPGGVWGPWEYVEGWDGNFYEQNGDTTGVYSDALPIQAEVDGAIAVSPVADLWIEKQVTPTTVYPGGWVTFTLRYGNDGNLAENVVISDVLPQGLTKTQVVGTWNAYGANIVSYDTFTWTVGNVPWNGRGNGYGVITVTAQVDQDYDWPWASTLTNTAEITTTTREQYQLPERPNRDWVTFTVAIPPTWSKWISGTLWHTGLSLTTETSDTIEIVDVISSGQHFTLRETWNPDHLRLISQTLVPTLGGSVITDTSALTLTGGGLVTLTKIFYVKPCTWTQTLLTETLWIDGQVWDHKPITINKQMPNLHIKADYEPDIFPGQRVTFTLTYSNTGGYENEVWIHSIFPNSVISLSIHPTPDDGLIEPDGTILVEWNRGDLAHRDLDTFQIAFNIQDRVSPSETIVISSTIHDHEDEKWDTAVLTFHVQPPEAVWKKHIYVNGVFTSTRPVPVVSSDTVQVVDRVLFTYTKPVTFTLVETWTQYLALTGTVDTTVGNVSTGPNSVHWSADSVATDTWHVLTKTFHVTGTEWLFDDLTETLTVEGDADTQQQVVRFKNKEACWPVNILTLTSNSPVASGHATTFSATVEGDPPITYTWDFDGAGTGSGIDSATPVYTYTNTGTYSVTLDVENDCGTDTQTLQVTVNPPPQPAWEKVVAVNGDIITSTSVTVAAGAVVEIVDRIWVTHTGNVTFTLVETWTSSLNITHWTSNTAQATVAVSSNAVTWQATDVQSNTWHIFTKTFEVLGGLWSTDHITEHLWVEDAVQLDDRYLTFTHGCEPLGSVDFDWSPPNPETGDVVTFTATYTPSYASTPVFEWSFGDGKTSTGNPVYNTYYLSGTYMTTLSATNDCTPFKVVETHTIVVTGDPFVPTYGVMLTPPTDVASGDPGDEVTYTLWVTNTGNVADTFDITASLSAWARSVTPSAINLPPSRTHQVTVTVTVPDTAQCGESDVVTITATSQARLWSPYRTVADFSVLTTSANAVRGVHLTPSTDSRSGSPGERVTYTLWMTNTGNCTDTLDLEVSGNLWTTTLSITDTGALSAGAGTSVDVTVDIPATASDGDDDTATLTATSSDGTTTATSALTTSAVAACTEITKVSLTIASAGTIYTDTVVTFEADIAPDNATTPYTYTVLIDSAPGSIMTSTTDPLVFTQTFATTGTHTVEVDAWNCNMSARASDDITLTVREQGACVDLTSVTIHGATSGPPNTYTFTTSYNPTDASLPISYTWDDGGRDDTSARSLGVGTHTLGVTATNICPASPAVTDVHKITVTTSACENVHITGLTSDSPVEVGQPMHFTATVTGDPTIHYTWDFGGAGRGNGLNGPTPTYTYTTTGTYTVTLKVANGCPSSDTQTLQVKVNPIGVCTRVSGADFNYDPPIPHTSKVITFTGHVAQGDTPITWTWAFDDGLSGNGQMITHTYTISDTYTVAMTATNCSGTGVATATKAVTVLRAPAKLYLPLILRSKSGT